MEFQLVQARKDHVATEDIKLNLVQVLARLLVQEGAHEAEVYDIYVVLIEDIFIRCFEWLAIDSKIKQ